MALFKIKKGLAKDLPSTYNEGYCYFTTDDGKFYIDTAGNGNSTGTRVTLNAEKATKDASGNVLTTTYLNKTGNDTMSGKLTLSKSFNSTITGTGTVGEDKGSSASPRYIPTKWNFNIQSAAPTDGDIVVIKVPCNGISYGVYLSINNATNYHPVVTNGTARLTTEYTSGMVLMLIYNSTWSASSIYALNGGNSSTTVSGGAWRVLNFYNTNTTYSSMTDDEITAGTGTTARTITPARLKSAIETWSPTNRSGFPQNDYGPSSNQTIAYNGTFSVPYFSVNANGVVTAAGNRTLRLPIGDSVLIETSANTQNKEFSSQGLTFGQEMGLFQVMLAYGNAYHGQINIVFTQGNQTLSKPIYINGSISSTSNYDLPAGPYFVAYDGNKFDFRKDGVLPGTAAGVVGNYVDLTTAQSISGEKTFNDTVHFDNWSVSQDSTTNALIFSYTT